MSKLERYMKENGYSDECIEKVMKHRDEAVRKIRVDEALEDLAKDIFRKNDDNNVL